MITEVSPTNTVKLDGSGNGRCAVSPPAGTKWSLRLATLATTTATKHPQGQLYRGSPSGPLQLVDSTFTGDSASSAKVGGALYYPGQWLWAVWTGGDPGATATLQAFGQQGTRSDPLPDSPLGEGFPNAIALIAGELDIGVSPNPRVFIGSTIPPELQAFYTAAGTPVTQVVLYYLNATDYYYQANCSGGSVTFANGLSIGGTIYEKDVYFWESFDAEPFWFVAQNTVQAIFVGSGVRAPSASEFWIFDASMSVESRGPLRLAGDTRSTGIVSEVSGADETWHSVTINPPWSNRGAGFPGFSYRLVPSPINSVQLVGQLTVGGAASGSTIGTLPAGYRPTTAIGAPAANDGASPEVLIEVETTGDIKAFCVGGFSTHIQINMLIPLDL